MTLFSSFCNTYHSEIILFMYLLLSAYLTGMEAVWGQGLWFMVASLISKNHAWQQGASVTLVIKRFASQHQTLLSMLRFVLLGLGTCQSHFSPRVGLLLGSADWRQQRKITRLEKKRPPPTCSSVIPVSIPAPTFLHHGSDTWFSNNQLQFADFHASRTSPITLSQTH